MGLFVFSCLGQLSYWKLLYPGWWLLLSPVFMVLFWVHPEVRWDVAVFFPHVLYRVCFPDEGFFV